MNKIPISYSLFILRVPRGDKRLREQGKEVFNA